VHGNTDNIAFWVKESLGNQMGTDVAVHAVRAQASLVCDDCRRRSSLEPSEDHEPDAHYLLTRCPRCGSAKVQVEGDAGCLIKRLELEC